MPYLRYRSYDDQGRPLKEPHRPNADPNLLPIAQSIALFSAQIEKTTAVPAARLGDIDPVTRSGKALDRLTANSKNSTSNFMQNLLRSVRYEGQVENNLLYPIYGARPGRLVRVTTGKGKPDLMLVHVAPNEMTPQEQQLMQRASQVAKLTEDATFNVNVKITRDYDTREEQEHAMLGEIFGANPETFNWYADIWFKSGHGPAADEMAERARMMLPPPIQQMLAAKAQGQQPPSPRELQLRSENAKLKQVAQQQGMELQTDAASNRTKMQIEGMRQQGENERAALERETKLAMTEIQALAKEIQDTRALFAEERARVGSQQHEAAMAHANAGVSAQEADAQRQHEVGMAHAQAGTDAEQADQDRQLQAQQAAQSPQEQA